MSAFVQALQSGYSSQQILHYLSQQNPRLASQIQQALQAGHSLDHIFNFISRNEKKMGKLFPEKQQSQQPYNIYKESQKNINPSLKGAATAGGILGLGTMGAYAISRAIPHILQSEIGQGITQQIPLSTDIPSSSQQVSPVQQASPRAIQQIPQQPLRNTQQPPIVQPNVPSAPTNQTNIPQQSQQIQPEIKTSNLKDILAKSGLLQHVDKLSAKYKDPKQIAAVLYNRFPKEMKDLQKNSGKPMEEAIGDYLSQNKSVDLSPQSIKLEEKISQNEKEKPIIETKPQKLENLEPESKKLDISEKTPEIKKLNVFEKEGDLKKLSEHKPISEMKERFAIPFYPYHGEKREQFEERNTLARAVEKAAKSIVEGKSFLDYPVPEQALKHIGGYSTAEDVLRFMAGIPNLYDPLLDEDEKEQLGSALLDIEDLSIPGLRPTKGERDIYGTDISPNLVWNLLVAVEPKVSELRPKSIKGHKMATGGKMGTTELRRFLTNSVYNVLSGKKITTQLADKISKISQSAYNMDALSGALRHGKETQQEEEMEKMLDDDYFRSLFTDEIEEMVRKYR